MSYNPGGWNDDKIKWMGLALLAAVALVGLAQWAGILDMNAPMPHPAR